MTAREELSDGDQVLIRCESDGMPSGSELMKSQMESEAIRWMSDEKSDGSGHTELSEGSDGDQMEIRCGTDGGQKDQMDIRCKVRRVGAHRYDSQMEIRCKTDGDQMDQMDQMKGR